MLIRLVKLTLQPSKVDDFKALFRNVEDKIRGFKGCKKLVLFKETKGLNIFFTYSEWVSEADLELYRKSELFKAIWKETKSCFSAPAEAWSLVDSLT